MPNSWIWIREWISFCHVGNFHPQSTSNPGLTSSSSSSCSSCSSSFSSSCCQPTAVSQTTRWNYLPPAFTLNTLYPPYYIQFFQIHMRSTHYWPKLTKSTHVWSLYSKTICYFCHNRRTSGKIYPVLQTEMWPSKEIQLYKNAYTLFCFFLLPKFDTQTIKQMWNEWIWMCMTTVEMLLSLSLAINITQFKSLPHNTILSRAGKSKSLIRWKRLKGGKRREKAEKANLIYN